MASNDDVDRKCIMTDIEKLYSDFTANLLSTCNLNELHNYEEQGAEKVMRRNEPET